MKVYGKIKKVIYCLMAILIAITSLSLDSKKAFASYGDCNCGVISHCSSWDGWNVRCTCSSKFTSSGCSVGGAASYTIISLYARNPVYGAACGGSMEMIGMNNDPNSPLYGVTEWRCTRCGKHQYSSWGDPGPCGSRPVVGYELSTTPTQKHLYSSRYEIISGSYDYNGVYATGNTTAATCTSPGTTEYTDMSGNLYYGQNGTALGHSYRNTVVNPTCTAQGYTNHYCTRCGYQYNDTIRAALGHSYTIANSRVSTYPTPYATGIRTFTCNRGCGHTTTMAEPAYQMNIWLGTQRISRIYIGNDLMFNNRVPDSQIPYAVNGGTSAIPPASQ